MNTFLRYYLSVPIVWVLFYLNAYYTGDDLTKYIDYKSQFLVLPILTYIVLIMTIQKFKVKNFAIMHVILGLVLAEILPIYILIMATISGEM